MKRIEPLLFAVLAASVVACSDGETSHGSTTGGEPAPADVQVRFELPASGVPGFLEVPFPSDLYRDASGAIPELPGMDAVVPRNGEYFVAAISQNGGFGTTAGAIFRIDDAVAKSPATIDASSLPQTEEDSIGPSASVMLVDLDPPDPASALVPARVAYHDDRALGAEMPPALVVYPARGVVLSSAHRYAAVVTTGVHDEDGQAVGASAAFAAIRDGARRSSEVEKAYGAAVDAVAALVPSLADPSKIAALTFYTTHDRAHELIDLRAQIASAPPPALSWDPAEIAPMGPGLFAATALPGYTATLDAWLGAPEKLPDGTDDPANDSAVGKGHDAIAALGTAVFEAPNLLLQRVDGYADPDHDTFARDGAGNPIPNPDKPTSKIWVTLILPKGAMPAAGFPTVIMQHGLSADRKFLLTAGNTFAKKGWATVGIESVTFGPRAPKASAAVDEHATWPWTGTAGSYDGPDGFVDKENGPVDFFGSLQNFGALRDHFRQSILDIGALVEVVRDPALDLGPLLAAVPGAKLDRDRLAFVGDSLGGIMGSMVAAVDPYVETFTLNVAGAGLIVELANAPYIDSQIVLAGGINFGLKKVRYSADNPVLQLMQHAIDPGDPLLYANHIVPSGKSVLQIEVVWDELVCNEADEALARAAGFALAEPSTGSRAGVPLAAAKPIDGEISGAPVAGLTAVVVQASSAAHGSDLFSRQGHHEYAHPWARFETEKPFTKLDAPFSFDQPYLALQGTMVDFFESALAGGVPVVRGFPAPVLDFDGDGALDADDAAPDDPTKH